MTMISTRAIIPIILAVVVGCDKTDSRVWGARSDPAVVATSGSRISEGNQPGHAGDKRSEFVSWDDFVRLQIPEDRQFLDEVDSRYFGAMSFESNEEMEFLLRSGFPTPAEWLEARGMTDEELQQQADSGNRKMAGILADRKAVQLTELLRLAAESPGTVSDIDRVRAATMAINNAHLAADGSSGAFGVYVTGLVKSRIFQTPEPLTAAMLIAGKRGDPRVDRLISNMARTRPKQDITRIHTELKHLDANRRR